MVVGVKTVTLGDLSGSESLLLLSPVDLVGLPMAAFKVKCAVLLLSMFLSLLLEQAGSIEVKLVLFILIVEIIDSFRLD